MASMANIYFISILIYFRRRLEHCDPQRFQIAADTINASTAIMNNVDEELCTATKNLE